MARIFITGSTDGLGLFNARTLIDQGHEVLLHARSEARAGVIRDLPSVGIVIGDLSSDEHTRSVADQVNEFGPVDAVIHNAGVYMSDARIATTEGHSRTLAVNVLAPYLLTALIHRPHRLVYISSGMHLGVHSDLDDIDWVSRRWNAGQAYSESKLYVSTLAAAVSRLWPDVLSNSVDPGWVPTKMGGPGASDDLDLGHDTQSWLAISNDPAATVTGAYWHHRRTQRPAAEVDDPAFQDTLLATLNHITGTALS
ncbi:SDR family NAD(P)-dependent oxidoreductase [Curtobacterium pusillum]|uniref:SDR family NAD(P)-dependent oxidoreductase n=1 Tax=Curtobacterium pusillum TaxID=69373 RepID=UPI00381DA868